MMSPTGSTRETNQVIGPETSSDDRLQLVEFLAHLGPRSRQIGERGDDLGPFAKQLVVAFSSEVREVGTEVS